MRKKTMKCGNTIFEDGTVVSRLGRTLSIQKSNVGYLRVELYHNGKGKKHSIHRLLAEAFIPNPLNKPQVNHIDGVKDNNSISNLEWVTQSENQKHAYATGLQKGYRKPGITLTEDHKRALCGSRWKGEKRIYHAGGEYFSTPEEAADSLGVSRQTFYNRVKSERFPSWKIEVRREEK